MVGTRQRKIALVIGAGGVKCAAALGALRALRQNGVSPHLIVGGSSGALFAAAIALGWDENRLLTTARRLWSRDLTARRNNRALLQALFPRRLRFDGRFGLRDDTLLRRRLHRAFGDLTFADTQTPLIITATDVMSGEQVSLRHGRLTDAIRASLSIPFVFAPWPVDGRLLADAYLSDPLPGNVAIREKSDLIIAVGFETPSQHTVDSPLRVALQLSSIMTNSLHRARVAFHTLSHHADIVLLAPHFRRRIDIFDTAQLAAIVTAGEETMRAHLPSLQTIQAPRPQPQVRQ